MPTIVKINEAPSANLPNGRGKSYKLFNPSNGVKNVDVHVNVLNPGVKRGTVHYHAKTEDIYVVLEGEGKIVDKDGREYPITVGDAIFFKPGEMLDTHEILNTGNTPLRVVEVYAPALPMEAYVGTEMDMSKRDHVPVREVH